MVVSGVPEDKLDDDDDDYEGDDEDANDSSIHHSLTLCQRVKDSIGDDRTIYSYITCATDKENVKIIWDVVRTTILENAMRVIALN